MIRISRSKNICIILLTLLSVWVRADDLALDMGIHQRVQQGASSYRVPIWIQGPGSFSGMNLRIELGGEAGSEFELGGAEWSSDEWLNQIPSAERDLIIFTGNGAMEVQWTSWNVNEVQVPAEGGRLLEIFLTPKNISINGAGIINVYPSLNRLGLESEFLNAIGDKQEIRLKTGKVKAGHPEFSIFGLPESGSSFVGWNPVWISEESLTPEWLLNGSLISNESIGSPGVYEWRLNSDEAVVFTSDPALLGAYTSTDEFRLQLVGPYILAHGPTGTALQVEATDYLGEEANWLTVKTMILEQSPSVISIPVSNPDTQIKTQFFRLKKAD